jgi:hypothetical protein
MPRPRSLPFFLESAAPVGEFQTFVHDMHEIAAVIGDTGADLVRHGVRRNEIAPPDLDRINADGESRAIHQLLDQKSRLRPAGAAIGRGRNGVGEHRARDRMHSGNLIDAGCETHGVKRHHHRRGEDMRTHGVQRIDAQPENLAALVQRQFAGHNLIAALGVAEQRLRTRRHPFDRTAADAARRPNHQRVLGIAAVLHAEAAADIR